MTSLNTNQQKQAGFTLIEILLVMIIIAVLVGIGLGSFRGSQIKSRDAKRVADLDQLARALEIYHNDKGHYPVSTTDGLIRVFYDADEDGEIEDEEYMDFNWGDKFYDPEHSSTIYMGNLCQEAAGDFRYYYQAYHRDFNTGVGDDGEYELSIHEESDEPDSVEAEGFVIYARLENEENSKYMGELEASCDSNPVETTPCNYVISSSNIQLSPTPQSQGGCMKIKMSQRENGFTLIELLVVIFIIGILSSVILVNIAGVRNRAKDVKRKGELESLKKALRLYYNDNQAYPAEGTNHTIDDTYVAGDKFWDETSETVYMKTLPETYRYDVDSSDYDSFRLRIDLENISDEEIEESQDRCPNTGSFNDIDYYATTYVVCEDQSILLFNFYYGPPVLGGLFLIDYPPVKLNVF